MIISDKSEQIAGLIMLELGRGVTLINGEGGYTHTKKENTLYRSKSYAIK